MNRLSLNGDAFVTEVSFNSGGNLMLDKFFGLFGILTINLSVYKLLDAIACTLNLSLSLNPSLEAWRLFSLYFLRH
jgi:hypothetical protein